MLRTKTILAIKDESEWVARIVYAESLPIWTSQDDRGIVFGFGAKGAHQQRHRTSSAGADQFNNLVSGRQTAGLLF